MSEPRDFHRFMELAERQQSASRVDAQDLDQVRARVDELAAALPESRPWARLMHTVVRLVVGLLPLVLWTGFGYSAFAALLLFCLESVAVGLANTGRILCTAASPPGARLGRRLGIAAIYLSTHTTLVLGLSAVIWYLFAPASEVQGLVLAADVRGMGEWLVAQRLVLPVAAVCALLLVEVVGRSDYIDAFLPLGPGTVARYGYTRPMGLVLFLILSPFVAQPSRGGAWLSPLSATYGAAFLFGFRLLLDVLNLWLPVWGRTMLGGVTRMSRRAEHERAERGRAVG